MLKVTIDQAQTPPRLTVEGRLAGPWVQELDRCWHDLCASHADRILVDLTGVTFVDSKGKELLTLMSRSGAELRASGCLTKCIVDEIAKEDR
jgi:anti-anti-sigma regulatory factor